MQHLPGMHQMKGRIGKRQFFAKFANNMNRMPGGLRQCFNGSGTYQIAGVRFQCGDIPAIFRQGKGSDAAPSSNIQSLSPLYRERRE